MEISHHIKGRGGLSRRRFLLDAGAALATVLGGSALAFAGPAEPADAAPLTDQSVALFLQSIEQAMVSAYAIASQTGKLHTPSTVALVAAYSGHHSAHATALGAFSGNPNAPANPGVLVAVADQMREAPDEMHLMSAAFDSENAIAATYLYAFGVLKGVQVLQSCAGIYPVESAHGATIGQILGRDPDTDADMVPSFETTSDVISISMYPPAG
ncbi:MAG: hypothetical protein ACRDZ8_07310 [Acidimicrobiales bacterium]